MIYSNYGQELLQQSTNQTLAILKACQSLRPQLEFFNVTQSGKPGIMGIPNSGKDDDS